MRLRPLSTSAVKVVAAWAIVSDFAPCCAANGCRVPSHGGPPRRCRWCRAGHTALRSARAPPVPPPRAHPLHHQRRLPVRRPCRDAPVPFQTRCRCRQSPGCPRVSPFPRQSPQPPAIDHPVSNQKLPHMCAHEHAREGSGLARGSSSPLSQRQQEQINMTGKSFWQSGHRPTLWPHFSISIWPSWSGSCSVRWRRSSPNDLGLSRRAKGPDGRGADAWPGPCCGWSTGCWSIGSAPRRPGRSVR